MNKFHIIEHTIQKNAPSTVQFTMPIEHQTCTGILIVSESLGLTTMEMLIDNREVFPKNFDTRLIRFTEHNSRRNVTWPLNEHVSNKLVKLTFNPSGMAVNEPVRIYFFVK